MIFGKKTDFGHLLDPVQYKLLLNILLESDSEPGAEAKTSYFGSSSGSGQKFRLLAASAPALQHDYDADGL
jgi:hypothetical protein